MKYNYLHYWTFQDVTLSIFINSIKTHKLQLIKNVPIPQVTLWVEAHKQAGDNADSNTQNQEHTKHSRMRYNITIYNI